MKVGLLIPLLILVLAAAVCFAKFAVIDRLNALAKEKAEVARLEQEIADEKARTESIESLREYMQSDEYLKQAAKDRLGLVESDEVIFRPQD